MRDITLTYNALRQVITDTWGLKPLFVTVTGVDLYGFASPDSDYDLRGAFMLPLRDLLGITTPRETITRLEVEDDIELDLVLYSVHKLGIMLADGNAAILEEALSPLILLGDDVAQPLREAARGCVTRKVFFHYNGFASSQIDKLAKEEPKRLKTLLYIYRILMTGIHALETGEIQSNIQTLNDRFRFPFIPDLVAAKVTEQEPVGEADWDMHGRTIRRLQSRLRRAHRDSVLPYEPRSLDELNEVVVAVQTARLLEEAKEAPLE